LICIESGLLGEEGSHLHHHTGLAITALDNLFLDPCPLHRMIFRKSFNGGNLLPLSFPDGNRAGPLGLAVNMDRACTTFSDATTELGARKLQVISDDPEQWHIVCDIDPIILSVDIKRNHDYLLFYKQRLVYKRRYSYSVPEKIINNPFRGCKIVIF
jgi:hypothetical protein